MEQTDDQPNKGEQDDHQDDACDHQNTFKWMVCFRRYILCRLGHGEIVGYRHLFSG